MSENDPLKNVIYEEVSSTKEPVISSPANKENKTAETDLPKWSWWGMIVSAVGAQLCCGLPWLLVSLGLGGSYIAELEAIRPYRPLFVTAAIVFFIAGWVVYLQRRRKGCPISRA